VLPEERALLVYTLRLSSLARFVLRTDLMAKLFNHEIMNIMMDYMVGGW
jgi:hypothetical protein